jgi:hypothetical protein
LPFYDLSAVAHAIDMEPKQLDNLLSRNTLSGVEKKKRGIARRLTPDVVVVIQIAKEIAEALDLSTGSLFSVAQRIADNDSGLLELGAFVTLKIDLDALRTATFNQLDAAVEVVGRRRRGRPPAQLATRLPDT